MPAERTTRGVDAALRVLGYLARQRGPVPAAIIQRDLRLPRSSTYRLLTSLEEQGFVLHLPSDRRYGLGLAAFELSAGFTRQEPLTRLGAPLLARLVDRVGETAHLSVLHGRDVLYLIDERARGRPSLITDVGVRLPSDVTASGRAMLSLLPPAQLRAIFPNDDSFSTLTSEPKLTYWKLRNLLSEVREAGFASENGEVTPGIASVAVGVSDHVGWPAAAIAISFETTVSTRVRAQMVAEARGVATELNRAIRGRP